VICIEDAKMKSKLIQDGQQKTFALVFDTGEEVVAGLLQFAKDHKLSGAHLTAIGAFERLTLGFFEVTNKDYKKIAIQEQVELMSLMGNIARDDKGDPKLHAHVVVGPRRCRQVGRHRAWRALVGCLRSADPGSRGCRSVAASAPHDARRIRPGPS
jgi:uncharacterized protein